MTAQSPHTSTAAARVERARAIIRRTLGAALAAKASDDLCLALTGPAPTTLGPVFEFEHERLAAVPPAARRATIDALRRDFERSTAAVVTELRRARPRATIETCWLNSTLQARVDPPMLAELAHDPQIRRVDVPRLVHLSAEEQVSDLAAQPLNVVLRAATGVRERHGLSGAGVVVGVIDTEVERDHPALGGRVQRAADISGVGWGTPGSHGTAVAGIVAADGSLLPPGAASSFRGVAPSATIRNYKIPRLATDMQATRAIEQAVEDGLRIVNCSFGVVALPLGGPSRVVAACDEAWAHGTAVIKSAGEKVLTVPADAAGVIVVGATDLLGTRIARDSPHGIVGGHARPDLVAPGGAENSREPWTTRPSNAVSIGTIGSVGRGTSIAAPHVTGLLALLLERRPSLQPDDLRERLLAACTPLPGVAAEEQGRGLLSPELLLER